MKNFSVTINWVNIRLKEKTTVDVVHLADDEDHAFEIALATLKARNKEFLKWNNCSIQEVEYSKFSFQSGTIRIESSSINDLKDFVEELDFLAKHSGHELSSTITDLCFDIERAYQAHHGLEENDFDKVH